MIVYNIKLTSRYRRENRTKRNRRAGNRRAYTRKEYKFNSKKEIFVIILPIIMEFYQIIYNINYNNKEHKKIQRMIQTKNINFNTIQQHILYKYIEKNIIKNDN